MSLLLILAFFVSSCAIFSPETLKERSIANVVNPPLNADELLTIRSSTQLINEIDQTEFTEKYSVSKGIKVDFIDDPKMSTTEAYKIVPIVEEQAYKIRIYRSPTAKNDLDASIELASVLNQLYRRKFEQQFSLFELYYNMKLQDITSLQIMAKIRKEALLDEAINQVNSKAPAEMRARFAENVEYWEDINQKFASQERLHNKNVKIQENARKQVMDVLDKVADDQQFRSLVASNNRKGAAALLKKYLPWELMPPFEKLFWENHLAVMADPLPYEERILIYRGIDDDIIQVAQKGGKDLSRAEAIKEQQIFLMSTIMTKNQGTWNRRLRSLSAMYEKYIATFGESSEYSKGARITTMFTKHASQPKGSPFLSYTPKFSIAKSFGSKRNTAYFIDPRMLYFNYTSPFTNEVEFLLPLASFPDDLAAVWDQEAHAAGPQSNQEFLKEKAIEKLNKKLGPGKGEEAYAKIVKNSEKYFIPVNKPGVFGALVSPLADEKFMNYFKKVVGMPTAKAAQEITEKNDMTCLDLIQLFWK